MLDESRAMIRLAWPVVLAEIGWVLMGIVDTIFVGPLGPAAIGAVGTGSTMFFAFMVFGIGSFFALDTFVAQNFGAGRVDECHRWLVAGLSLACVLSVVLVAAGLAGACCSGTGDASGGARRPAAVLSRLMWSAPPLLVFTVLRRYLQAMNVVRPVMLAIVIANLVNAVGNWVFIYGQFGSPALGAVGSAYATLAARARAGSLALDGRCSARATDAIRTSRRAVALGWRTRLEASCGSAHQRPFRSRSRSACLRWLRRSRVGFRRLRLRPIRSSSTSPASSS